MSIRLLPLFHRRLRSLGAYIDVLEQLLGFRHKIIVGRLVRDVRLTGAAARLAVTARPTGCAGDLLFAPAFASRALLVQPLCCGFGHSVVGVSDVLPVPIVVTSSHPGALMQSASHFARIGQLGGEASLNEAAAAAICLHASSLT